MPDTLTATPVALEPTKDIRLDLLELTISTDRVAVSPFPRTGLAPIDKKATRPAAALGRPTMLGQPTKIPKTSDEVGFYRRYEHGLVLWRTDRGAVAIHGLAHRRAHVVTGHVGWQLNASQPSIVRGLLGRKNEKHVVLVCDPGTHQVEVPVFTAGRPPARRDAAMSRPDAKDPSTRSWLHSSPSGVPAVSRPPERNAADKTHQALQVLAADLRDLALDLQAGTYTRTTVAMLQRDLRQVVPSALGATVFFDLDTPSGIPKEINLCERTLDPSEILAGLRLPLILPQQSLTGWILFYAAQPGAFDDVVEDLLTLLGTDRALVDHAPELPSSPVSPSVADVEDFSVVNDALGVLISRGNSLTEARNSLHDYASQAQNGLPGAARTLLDGPPTRRGRRAVSLLKSLATVMAHHKRPPESSQTRQTP